MPKRKRPELDPKEQFKRFVETTKKLGLDESGKDVEKVFKDLAQGHQQDRRRQGALKRHS